MKPDLRLDSLRRAYRDRALTVRELVDALDAAAGRIEGNPLWIARMPLEAQRARAAALDALGDEARAALPLFGIPFAVKDNIDVAGLATTAGCPAYAYRPERSATAVERLAAAGALLVGKTNLDQFATGLVGARSPHGACHNAFSPAHVSGGSSSGSALAVALSLASFALGTDTAGSGRVPAAFNNIVGLKPTRGRISTAGVVPACRSLDCVSIFALGADDAMAIFGVLDAADPRDPFTRRPGRAPAFPAEGFRFAVPNPGDLEFDGDAGYEALFAAARERLLALGGEEKAIDYAPFLEAQALLYDGPLVAERWAALGAFAEGHAADLHPVTARVLASGSAYGAAELFRAFHRLAELKVQCDAALAHSDFLLVPGAPTLPRLDELERDPIALNSRLGRYTNFVNPLDYAAIAVPAGFRDDGLPFGVTLVGAAHSEASLAAVAARLHAAGAQTVGACGTPVAEPSSAPATGRIPFAVVGAHLTGLPLNGQLVDCGARLDRATRTAPCYRLYELPGTSPRKPGLVRVGADGSAIDVEVWDMPVEAFGAFVAAIPSPLSVGTVELEDGPPVKGFLCEAAAIAAASDITAWGGWRRYLGGLRAA